MRKWQMAFGCFGFALCVAQTQAQELSLFGGGMRAEQNDDHSYAWSLDYRHRLGNHSSIGLTYLNEGHPGNHHRDGISTQFWLHTRAPRQGLSLAAGLGPYYYFDTTSADPNFHQNVHGWGSNASLSATWQFASPWFVQLRANYIHMHNSLNSKVLLLGVGYQLRDNSHETSAPSGLWATDSRPQQELTLSVGRTIVNSFRSERTTGSALEYRRGLGPHLDWTVSLINEGDASLLNRSGVTTQLWMVRPWDGGRFSMGVGVGPYLTFDQRDDNSRRVTGMLSLSARYRITPHWLARMSWNRVMTPYHRDTDVLLLGAGYAF